jgi:hypothetical protein
MLVGREDLRWITGLSRPTSRYVCRSAGSLSGMWCGDDIVSDVNQVLFVTAGETYRVTEPLPGGYAELIITPKRSDGLPC